MKMKVLAAFVLSVGMAACSTDQPVNRYSVDDANRLLELCGAGLGASISAKAQAQWATQSASGRIDITSDVHAFIVSDASLSGDQKITVYNTFVQCIEKMEPRN